MKVTLVYGCSSERWQANAGESIELADDIAERLLARGIAVPYNPAPEVKRRQDIAQLETTIASRSIEQTRQHRAPRKRAE